MSYRRSGFDSAGSARLLEVLDVLSGWPKKEYAALGWVIDENSLVVR